MYLSFVLFLSGCGNNVEPTPTPEPTPAEHIGQETLESTESILSVAKAQDIISGIYEYYKIAYMPEMNKQEGEVSHYAFIVDYTGNVSETSAYTYCYAWVNSVTGFVKFEEAGYTEANGRNLYANLPDSMFPIPMINGTVIPYDEFSPPEYVLSVAYSYADKNVMEIYQAQIREAGFVNHGQVMSVDSLWTYERDKDGATLMVEFRYGGDEEGFTISY